MGKDYFKGEYGKWVTMNGAHIFIADGEDPEHAFARFTEPEWAEHHTKSEYAKHFADKITYADFRYHYLDDNDNRIMPGKYAKRMITRVLQERKYRNEELDSFILGGLNKSVTELIINDRDTNWFKGSLGVRRVQLSIGTRPEMLESISHEIAHAIDYRPLVNEIGTYYSTAFISPTYGKTMMDMFLEEYPDDEMVEDEIGVMVDAMHNAKSLDENAFISSAISSVVDTVQAVRGDEECRSKFGYLPHPEKYFSDDYDNTGTELFAELTASLFCHKTATFYNFIKQHCPRTIEIYHEIIEEVQKKWKKS